MVKAKKSGKKGPTLTEEILRYRLMYIKEFESITPEAAKLLTASGGHKLGDSYVSGEGDVEKNGVRIKGAEKSRRETTRTHRR